MELLKFVDMHYLYSFLSIFILFGIFAVVATRQYRQSQAKVDQALRAQIEGNQMLSGILSEIRRSNRLLSEMVGIEQLPYSNDLHSSGSQDFSHSEGSNSETFSQNKLYVGNIDYAVTESELATFFSRYGQVEFVNIPVNRYTGRARGFGFVTFAHQEEAERAISLNGTELKGRQIQVNFAKEREVNS